jgi:hypothetical protein
MQIRFILQNILMFIAKANETYIKIDFNKWKCNIISIIKYNKYINNIEYDVEHLDIQDIFPDYLIINNNLYTKEFCYRKGC